MIVLKDKHNHVTQRQDESKPKTYKITCEHCNSELEVEDDDIQVGAYGMGYVVCPCCGEATYADELADYFPLTKDNVEFPVHYYSFNKAVSIADNTINKWVKECIETFDSNDENDCVRYTGSGDTMVFVFKLFDGDKEYDVYVCKNYYETFIPFNKNND